MVTMRALALPPHPRLLAGGASAGCSAFKPPERSQALPKCVEAALHFGIALGQVHEHRKPPNSISLLRAPHQWPTNGAPNRRDQLPPPHLPKPLAGTGHRTGSKWGAAMADVGVENDC